MMTQRKLTDSELAARLRQRNRDSSERRRERLALAGHTQLLTWIPASLRERVDAAAAASGLKLSPMVERLLTAGLNATTTPAANRDTPASNDTQPVYTGVVSSRDVLMNEVAALLNEGLSGADIARQLNASGKRTANGAQFTSANLLRDYRAWLKKNGATDIQPDSGA